ncbi:MAG: FAD-binding oxidoreductase, partial [Roseovarius confluentis]
MSTDADTLLSDLRNALGAPHVLTGDAAAPYRIDWMGDRRPEPLAVLRPADTGQVSAILQAASRHGTPVVPISGNTGLTHGTDAGGGLLLSLDRLNTIREIRPDARVAVVEAGVILAHLHEAAEAHDLIFPLTFGARG